MKIVLRILQFGLIAAFILFLAWIFNVNFAFWPVSFTQDFKGGEYEHISDLDSILGQGSQEYKKGREVKQVESIFQVFKREAYKNVKLELDYQNIDQEEVVIGLSGYSNNILENNFLDNLNLGDYFTDVLVDEVDGNTVYLYQKDKKYNSVIEVQNNISDQEKYVLYGYEFPYQSILNSSSGNEDNTGSLDNTIRGKHFFYLFLKDGNNGFSINYYDRNYYQGEDSINIILWKNNENVYSIKIGDDGNGSNNKKPSSEVTHNLNFNGIDEGAYIMEVDASSDIFITNLEVVNAYLAIKDEINLADPGESFIGYTDQEEVRFLTKHAGGLQKIRFGENSIEIEEVDKEYYLTADPYSEIVIPRSDMLVSVDGLITSTENDLYVFSPKNIKDFESIDNLNNADYFITTYSIDNNEKEIYFYNLPEGVGKLDFSIKLPGFEDGDAGIVINNIKITYSR